MHGHLEAYAIPLWVLQFIDHATQMQMNDVIETNAEIEARPVVEVDAEPSNMESWKSQVQTIEEAIHWLNQWLGSFLKVVVEDYMNKW